MVLSDNKKYYYMRLKEDFFDSDEIKIIESQPNGYMYSNILLKLYLKSLKRTGKLMVTDLIPYTLESLSKVLGHNIDTVRNAIAIFKEAGIEASVMPIPTSEYITTAKRPMYSVLDNKALREKHGYYMKDWKDALKEFMVEIR
jgi:predicted phage replisome organizer